MGETDAPGRTFSVPQGISLRGHLFDEGSILNLGMALERELGVAEDRPCICVQTTCQWGSAQATNQHGGALGYDEAPVPRQF